MKKNWRLNTSNPGKLSEYKRIFAKYGESLSSTEIDLPEIQGDPLQVIAHKAAQLEESVLVDDSSLDVEGADVGIQIRWLMDQLSKYEGRKAHWRVLLAYREKDLVYVYEGKVDGRIVAPRGKDGFGFDPVFLPDGSDRTLAEEKTDRASARAKAVEALLKGKPSVILPAISEWEGEWQ